MEKSFAVTDREYTAAWKFEFDFAGESDIWCACQSVVHLRIRLKSNWCRDNNVRACTRRDWQLQIVGTLAGLGVSHVTYIAAIRCQ
jgi:hypothetical protein